MTNTKKQSNTGNLVLTPGQKAAATKKSNALFNLRSERAQRAVATRRANASASSSSSN
jgi:hypothetical protein